MPATATQNAAIQSAVAGSAQDGDDVTNLTYWSALTGGNYLGTKAVTNNPAAIATGGRFTIASGEVRFTVPNGDGTNHFAERMARGIVEGGIWVQFHTGSPGSNGTSSVISLARVAMAASLFSFART